MRKLKWVVHLATPILLPLMYAVCYFVTIPIHQQRPSASQQGFYQKAFQLLPGQRWNFITFKYLLNLCTYFAYCLPPSLTYYFQGPEILVYSFTHRCQPSNVPGTQWVVKNICWMKFYKIFSFRLLEKAGVEIWNIFSLSSPSCFLMKMTAN